MRSSGPIFLLVPSLEQGGTERQATLLALTLRRKNLPVHVIVFRGGVFAHDIEAAGIPLTTLGGGGWMSYFPALARLLRKEKPSAIYSFLPHANVVSAIVRLVDPECRLIWGIRSADMPLAGYGLKTRLAYWLERSLSSLPHRIITNSKSGAASCVRKRFPGAGHSRDREWIRHGIVRSRSGSNARGSARNSNCARARSRSDCRRALIR